MQEKLKKPKKPIEPIEPKKPVFPTKTFTKKADYIINITDDMLGDSFQISFKELIDIRNKIDSTDENIILKVSAGKEYDGGCDYSPVIEAIYFEAYKETINSSFEKEMAIYENKLKDYQEKYEKYLKDKKDYKEQLKKYNLEYKQYQISILEKQIEKLKG